MSDVLKKVTRWTGLIASIATLVLGIIFICMTNAHIRWPEHHFTHDENLWRWRQRLFTFAPSIFIDLWTPTVFGIIGTLVHTAAFKLELITASFLRFFLFMFVQAMFANLGYSGGLGIIVSIVSFLAALLSLIAFFIDDDKANLDMKFAFSAKDRSGAGVSAGN